MSLSKMWQPTLFGKAPTEEKYVSNPSNQYEKFMNKYFKIHGDAGKNRKDLSRYGQKRWNELKNDPEKNQKIAEFMSKERPSKSRGKKWVVRGLKNDVAENRPGSSSKSKEEGIPDKVNQESMASKQASESCDKANASEAFKDKERYIEINSSMAMNAFLVEKLGFDNTQAELIFTEDVKKSGSFMKAFKALVSHYSKSPHIRTYFFESQAEIGSYFKDTMTNIRVDMFLFEE